MGGSSCMLNSLFKISGFFFLLIGLCATCYMTNSFIFSLFPSLISCTLRTHGMPSALVSEMR